MTNKNAAISSLIYFLSALYAAGICAADYSDSFDTDTTARYTVTDDLGTDGIGELLYDASRQSLSVLTGDNVALRFSGSVPPTESGYFHIDFLPVRKHPNGGIVVIRLIEDGNNYYEIKNTDGYGLGRVKKFVNGRKKEVLRFGSEYFQGTSYRIKVTFDLAVATVEAFGSVLTMGSGSDSISVRRFEVEVGQQDAYFDNIFFQAGDLGPMVSVGLQWDANVEPNVSGYKIYYNKTGSSGAPYDGLGLLQGDSPIVVPVETLYDRDNPEYILEGLSEDATYHIAVTAYDDQYNESGYSNEVVFP